PRRDVELACLKDGKLYRAADTEAALRKLGGDKGIQAPAIAFGADNRLRLFFRQPVNVNWLAVGSTAWSETGWTKPGMLLYSEGRLDQRIVATQAGGKIVAVYPAGSSHNSIYARMFETGPATGADPIPQLTGTGPIQAKSALVPASRHILNGYQLVWGD